MAVLITGLGYIGSALARRLLDAGESVVGVESFFSTPRAPIEQLARSGLTLVEGSITEPRTIERALDVAPIDVVFHLAAQSSAQPNAAPIAYTQETNFTGPRILMEACARRGVRRIVLASSMRLYRPPLPRTLTEQSPIHAPDLVHLSQLYAEVLLRTYGLAGVGARLGIVHGVGPVMKTDPRFLAVPQRFCLQAAWGEPLVATMGTSSALAFVHLEDAVEGLLRCRDLPDNVRIANVAAEVRSVASVAQAVQAASRARGIEAVVRYTGRRVEPRPRRPHSVLDARGFKPARAIEDSVGEVLDHYLSVTGHAAEERSGEADA